ncbi:hypothetical protein BS78_05G209100 [Paspalum vaginatum]|nr:hypothetical protein BS78_05G209100 [Paspalum vaginatum]
MLQLNKKRKKGIRTRTRSTRIAQKNHKVLQFKGIWIGTINTLKNDNRMLQFKGVLESFVFFALPSMLVFYPTGVKDEAATCQMLITNGTVNVTSSTPNTEEKAVVATFALFALIWIPALLLATFGKGKGCVSLVGVLTYVSVICVVAFIVFALSKTMPETTMYSIIFVGYFIVLFCTVTYLWARYVWRAKYSLPRISLHSLQVLLSTRIKWRKTQQENQLKRPLLSELDMV